MKTSSFFVFFVTFSLFSHKMGKQRKFLCGETKGGHMNHHIHALNLGTYRPNQLAYDGRFYYFTLFTQKKIIKTGENFSLEEEIPCQRIYDCLCFDPVDCCFWATVCGCATRIFQLTLDMTEISCHTLPPQFAGGKICGLSHHGCKDSIYIAFATTVGIFHKNTGEFHPLPPVKGLNLAILAICPAYLLLVRQGKKQMVYSFWDSGEEIRADPLPQSFTVQDFVYNPCHSAQARLDFLIRQGNCYTKISPVPVSPHELGFQPCICNHKICQYGCDCDRNFQPVADIITSIALIETALSHILNAQGEELEKVVANATTTEEMLKVNAQINTTISKVTLLERVLYDKLEKITEFDQIPPHVKAECCHKFSAKLVEKTP